MSRKSINCWAPGDRPREKFRSSGASALSDSELIAILIRNGTGSHNAVELAREILNGCKNNLHDLGRAGLHELMSVKGVGAAKAITLLAALELGRRCRTAEAMSMKKITCSRDAVSLLEPILRDLQHEEFWIILLNRANAVIDQRMISKGGVSGTVVDPKIIFNEALKMKASGIIVSHNHPSNNPRPSESDLQLTKKLREGGKLMEISLLDHIIIAGTSFYSFADEGVL